MFILINHCYYFGIKNTCKGNSTHEQNTDRKRETYLRGIKKQTKASIHMYKIRVLRERLKPSACRLCNITLPSKITNL